MEVRGKKEINKREGSAQPYFSEKDGAGQALQNFHKENLGGQAALSLVLLVGGTVVLIAATLFFLVLSFINSTFGFQAANQAWGLALSGANDALLQLSRNPTMVNRNYDFEIDNRPVGIEIRRACSWLLQGEGCAGDLGSIISNKNQVVINSSALVAGRVSVLTVFASVGQDGKVDVIEVRYYVPSEKNGGGIT